MAKMILEESEASQDALDAALYAATTAKKDKLEEALKKAMAAVMPEANLGAVQVRPSSDAKFGDYQSSAVMALAKERKTNPRQLATEILGKLDVSAWCEKVEIAGPGFLNFRLKASAVEQALQAGREVVAAGE